MTGQSTERFYAVLHTVHRHVLDPRRYCYDLRLQTYTILNHLYHLSITANAKLKSGSCSRMIWLGSGTRSLGDRNAGKRGFGLSECAAKPPSWRSTFPLQSQVLPYSVFNPFIPVFFSFQLVSVESRLTSVPRPSRIST
jgi:hypothetical protein